MATLGASGRFTADEEVLMRRALKLAQKAYGWTSPNPLVGAVLVKNGNVLGEGWHQRAGGPHAEVNAIRNARAHGNRTEGATLFVTLEPCSTHGRTPPCTEAIRGAGIAEIVAGATDPNPQHRGKGFSALRKRGIKVRNGLLASECAEVNQAFNHWIVAGTPFVTLKAAMTLDGKIATRTGESKWITSEESRKYAMRLRRGADAVLVGINTVVADDPALTLRPIGREKIPDWKRLRRLVLDPEARLPLAAGLINGDARDLTTIVVSGKAAPGKTSALEQRVRVWRSPGRNRAIDLKWLLCTLGAERVTSLLIEGGGETSAAFLEAGLVNQVAFFYAPKIVGGRDARKAVAGAGLADNGKELVFDSVRWQRLGPDLLLTACVKGSVPIPHSR